MYGLPARPLTEEEDFLLDLCLHRASMRLVKIAVEAARIAEGRVGPREYYDVDAETDEEGRIAYETAVMQEGLRRARPNRTAHR